MQLREYNPVSPFSFGLIEALVCFFNAEFNTVALVKILIAILADDGRMMHEDITFIIITANKAKSLGAIEPLDSSGVTL